jgi:hypothetical protein
MRGWIYVASVRGGPGLVRIGRSPVDPQGAGWRADGGQLHYDAVVDAPDAVLRIVQGRLAALRSGEGRYRCSPEFAVAALHHALGGPPAGERFYDPAAGSRRAHPAVAAHQGERGGSTTALALPAVGMLAAVTAAAWLAVRTPTVPDASPHAALVDPGFMPITRLTPPAVHPERAGAEPRSVVSAASSASAVPAGGAPPHEGGTIAGPPSAQECAALEALLARCAARRGRNCAEGTAGLAADERKAMQDMRRAGRAYDAAALENFCRAACRHGYRPARADFAATVCRVPR